MHKRKFLCVQRAFSKFTFAFGLYAFASLAAEEAANHPRTIILAIDEKQEMQVVPRLEVLEKLKLMWTHDDFRRRCASVVSLQMGKPESDPRKAAFSTEYTGHIERDVPLSELAELELRPITFVSAEDLKALAERLTGTDRDSAQKSLQDVNNLNFRARNLVPMLLPALERAEGWDKAETLCAALEYIGPHAVEAVSTLVKKLREARDYDKRWYARTLAAIGTPALAALKDLVVTEKDLTRQEAAEALVKAGKGGTALARELLEHEDPRVREAAAKVLAYSKELDDIPVLQKRLRDADPEVCERAAYALGRHGSLAREAVPALLDLLAGTEMLSMRGGVIYALGEIHAQPDKVVPVLAKFIEVPFEQGGDGEMLCCSALQSLGKFKAEAAAVVPSIRKVLIRSKGARAFALEALAQIKAPASVVAVHEVANLVADEDAGISKAALKALYGMGPGAAPALEKVLGALKGPHRGRAAMSLGMLGPDAKAALPHLARQLYSVGSIRMPPEVMVRSMAAIDIDAASRAIADSLREDKKIVEGWKTCDMREEALDDLKGLKEEAARLSEESAHPPQVARHVPVYRNPIDLSECLHGIQKGDSLTRVLALFQSPQYVDPQGRLVWETWNYAIESKVIIRVILQEGQVGEVLRETVAK